MAINLSNSLVGLSILSGSNSFTSGLSAMPTFESKAVRAAKTLFTLKETTPPWRDTASTVPLSVQAKQIAAMKTIIDRPDGLATLNNADIGSCFTTYKALDRLRTLAELASQSGTSDAQRAALQKTFAKGMAELQSFLVSAPSDLVHIAFAQVSSAVKSQSLATGNVYAMTGKALVTNRADAIPGLTGQEKFSIALSRNNSSETITVDLSAGPQPPTLDSVADAFNAAIGNTKLTNTDGSPLLDKNGNPLAKWSARFVPTKIGDKWGFKLDLPVSSDRISINQIDAKDALVVATGRGASDSGTTSQVFRINDPAGAANRTVTKSITARDSLASEQLKLAGTPSSSTTTVTTQAGSKPKIETKKNYDAFADTTTAAAITDAQGSTYIVGTTRGDVGTNLSNGSDNLFLTKMDGDGNILWQRSLGAAGASSGAAISLAPDGGIVVAGTITGRLDEHVSDGDMVVARYNAMGDELFSTVIPSAGADAARAVAVGADGSIFVGGKVAGAGGGDAFVARIDATGHVADRYTFPDAGRDSLTALAIAPDGNLLALVSSGGEAQVHKLQAGALGTDLGTISLGTADARAIAVAADGTIAVGGATSGALPGGQVNAPGGGRDGFVARIDAGLSQASITYLATGQDDQVDSVTFLGGAIYAGGRTTGTLGASRSGTTDGFVARIDAASGAIARVDQFGQSGTRTEAVMVSADAGGNSAVSALGFARGTINPPVSGRVTTLTGANVGDSFAIRLDSGTLQRIEITANDTLSTLADRIGRLLGSKATVNAMTLNGRQSLSITMKPGHSLQLVAGPAESDALARLGIAPQQIVAAPATPKGMNTPKVSPGGNFSLDLTNALTLSTLGGAKAALAALTSAVSMSQTAYRSLYWDDSKALLVDGARKSSAAGGSTAIEEAQLANYTAALKRLSSSGSSPFFL
ncbi:hypothetical protein [uncultured Sphingomonas sp.]|uniref:hypothetical protein n=1 Tax=uncultured Sphingomonas sp. TaxID=158754 RepID=UPI002605C060|nr:hypothetical protein [uncultured Sphingomonas sp.]